MRESNGFARGGGGRGGGKAVSVVGLIVGGTEGWAGEKDLTALA